MCTFFAVLSTWTLSQMHQTRKFLGLISGGAVHAQDYSEGTIDIWLSPFESDSNNGTTEYTELMTDSDTGSWHTTDIQLIIDDTSDPNQTFNQSTGWNHTVALNCSPTLDHAGNRLFDFFTPVASAQTYNGIGCGPSNDYQFSWELVRQARNGLGVAVATASGAFWPCRWTGAGWLACIGSAAVANGLAYVAYEYGGFVVSCRCRYFGQACA
jgi:hypothetical protein